MFTVIGWILILLGAAGIAFSAGIEKNTVRSLVWVFISYQFILVGDQARGILIPNSQQFICDELFAIVLWGPVFLVTSGRLVRWIKMPVGRR